MLIFVSNRTFKLFKTKAPQKAGLNEYYVI